MAPHSLPVTLHLMPNRPPATSSISILFLPPGRGHFKSQEISAHGPFHQLTFEGAFNRYAGWKEEAAAAPLLLISSNGSAF